MHDNYDDIKSRIAEQPTWYDENGCPRYGKFTPDHCPNIYSHQVVLLRIACQYCGEQFHVEMSASVWGNPQPPKEWHYGDPPNHNCRGAGDTMNCEDLDVLEVWYRPPLGEWERKPELEGVSE